MTTRASPNLLLIHGRSLSSYRHALTAAQAQLDALQTTVTTLQANLSEKRADEAFWKKRVLELDRLLRVQNLELTAAKRGQREAEQECARVRVELEDMRRGIKRVRRRNVLGFSVRDRETQTDVGGGGGAEEEEEDDEEEQVVREWVQHTGVVVGECGCGAARAVRGLFLIDERGNRIEEKGKGVEGRGGRAVPGRGEPGGDRERRRLLREKLKATKKRVDGRLERVAERADVG